MYIFIKYMTKFFYINKFVFIKILTNKKLTYSHLLYNNYNKFLLFIIIKKIFWNKFINRFIQILFMIFFF